MEQEITNSMLYQDERDLTLIQLLQRARDRETLDAETTRKLDEIEKRVENGEHVPDEEIQLFFKAVTDSSEHSQRFDILREKIEAYNKEQMSVQDERIAFGEERSALSRMEKDLSKQMELAVSMGDTEKMEEIQKQMDILQKRREELPKPQELEHQPQISAEEKDLVYEQLEQYGEHLQEEIDANTVKTPEFSIDDIKEKVGDVKESGYKNRMEAIKRDRQAEREQNMERI